MRMPRCAVIALCTLLWSPPLAPGQDPEGAAGQPGGAAAAAGDEARAKDLARAGASALAGDQYDRRHAVWSAQMGGGEIREIPVQLYAGNEYGFVLGTDAPSAVCRLEVYDARGGLVPVSVQRGEGTVVVAFRATCVGLHRVRVVAMEPVAVALTYVYK